MPKNKKKLKGGAVEHHTNMDDSKSEINADENASTISNPSSSVQYQDIDDEGPIVSEDVQNQIDNIEIQINNSLEGLQEKGFKEREDALKLINKLFSTKYLNSHIIDKRFTLVECLSRSLKRGKANEQLLAAQAIMLLLIQFGYSSDSEYLIAELKDTLINFIKNDKIESEIRAMCAKAIALGIFIVHESANQITDIMDTFENLFQSSYLKGDGSVKIHTKDVYQLHTAALSSWSLLFSILPLQFVSKMILKRIIQFQDFLKSPDVELRIVAGETIAILYEIGHCDANLDISSIDNCDLIDTLNELSKESGKSKSKKDRRIQHSSFRDILRTIEEGELPDSQTIKFGNEELTLDNWVRKKHYKTFRDLLGTGINCHLQENDLIRDIFDLGAPIIVSDNNTKNNSHKIGKTQRAHENKERFRHRTKNMNKKRDNKRNNEDYNLDLNSNSI